jgi:hypothetical protein
VALAHTPQLLERRLFNNKALSRNVNDFGQELKALEKQGYIQKQQNQQGADSWRILPAAFQWWLADELVRTVRSEKDFVQWIQAQEWGSIVIIVPEGTRSEPETRGRMKNGIAHFNIG